MHSTGHGEGRRAAAGVLSTPWSGGQGVSGQSPPISNASWGLSFTLWVGDTDLGPPTSYSGREICKFEGRWLMFSGNHQLIPVFSEIMPSHLDSSQRDSGKEKGSICCQGDGRTATRRDPAGCCISGSGCLRKRTGWTPWLPGLCLEWETQWPPPGSG